MIKQLKKIATDSKLPAEIVNSLHGLISWGNFKTVASLKSAIKTIKENLTTEVSI